MRGKRRCCAFLSRFFMVQKKIFLACAYIGSFQIKIKPHSFISKISKLRQSSSKMYRPRKNLSSKAQKFTCSTLFPNTIASWSENDCFQGEKTKNKEIRKNGSQGSKGFQFPFLRFIRTVGAIIILVLRLILTEPVCLDNGWASQEPLNKGKRRWDRKSKFAISIHRTDGIFPQVKCA